MKKINLLLFVSFLCFGFSGGEKVKVEDLKKFAATETYPEDTFLDGLANKKALVIVAHDDDDCGMSGTIAKLTAKGFQIKQISLEVHTIKKLGANPAGVICLGNEKLLADDLYRPGMDTMKKPYAVISYAKIREQYLWEKVGNAIMQKVNEFQPAVVFTLDNEKGVYGHPDHIFISQLVKDLFEQGKINIEKIYQCVYTDHMETEIMEKWLPERMIKFGFPGDGNKIANETLGITGMPEPTVQVNITSVAETKMKYLTTYEENVAKNFRKFLPYYDQFDGKTYFGVFDREFFRVIEKK